MIDVDFLYKKMQDILIENQSGYFSNEEYNRDLVLAQNDLLNFLTPSTTAKVSDLLQRFIVEYSTNSNTFPLPSLYYMRLSCNVVYFRNNENGIIKVVVPAIEMSTDDEYELIGSSIRRPGYKTKTAYYNIEGGLVKIYYEGNNLYNFKYLRRPSTPSRAVILDYLNEVENYDPLNTTHLEWDEQAIVYFVDILSYYRGIENRESEVVSWLSNKQLKHDERNVSRPAAN